MAGQPACDAAGLMIASLDALKKKLENEQRHVPGWAGA